MNPVEAEILAFIKRRLDEGATSVAAGEILEAVVPKEHPEYRFRPAYKHGLDRLNRRQQVWSIRGKDGQRRYYLDPHAIPWKDPQPPAEA